MLMLSELIEKTKAAKALLASEVNKRGTCDTCLPSKYKPPVSLALENDLYEQAGRLYFEESVSCAKNLGFQPIGTYDAVSLLTGREPKVDTPARYTWFNCFYNPFDISRTNVYFREMLYYDRYFFPSWEIRYSSFDTLKINIPAKILQDIKALKAGNLFTTFNVFAPAAAFNNSDNKSDVIVIGNIIEIFSDKDNVVNTGKQQLFFIDKFES